MNDYPKVSVVVLSFNRPKSILRCVNELLIIDYPGVEIIVVDNCSEFPVREVLPKESAVKIIRMSENVGVAGRNAGISSATGEFIITLDDDVFGLSYEAIDLIIEKFRISPDVGAINFKVIDDVTEKHINWSHHRKVEDWCDKSFPTYEISEGAVAFRRSVLEESGLYPDYFFISHEGPDLAIRIMNVGSSVVYEPEIVVRHTHAPEGRPGWRRYYYDSRNVIWLSIRCYPFKMGFRKIFIGLGSLFIYALRDGYLKFWIMGVFDAIKNSRSVYNDRIKLSKDTLYRYRSLERMNPSFCYMVRKRISNKEISI